jgi:hypothetical protein
LNCDLTQFFRRAHTFRGSKPLRVDFYRDSPPPPNRGHTYFEPFSRHKNGIPTISNGQ